MADGEGGEVTPVLSNTELQAAVASLGLSILQLANACESLTIHAFQKPELSDHEKQRLFRTLDKLQTVFNETDTLMRRMTGEWRLTIGFALVGRRSVELVEAEVRLLRRRPVVPTMEGWTNSRPASAAWRRAPHASRRKSRRSKRVWSVSRRSSTR